MLPKPHTSSILQNYGTLCLANGTSWTIAGENGSGSEIAASLAKIMQLKPSKKEGRHLLVIKNGLPVNSDPRKAFSLAAYEAIAKNKPAICQVYSTNNKELLAIQQMALSLVFCSQAEKFGGVYIHGALVEKDGQGILLAGPGDRGKTTASSRMPSPWKSLSDDSTLLTKDKKGRYQAHPWPTWGAFMSGKSGGTWNVQHSVPLKAIFLLKQSKKDFVEPLGKGQAVSLLNEIAEQVWLGLSDDFDNTIKKEMRLQRFENICEMIKVIPVYLLHLSLTGSFWKEIDKVLN
jgi:SynChlorMet cassette protein ScmC